MRMFDRHESAYTATAQFITPAPGVAIDLDFAVWGTPERTKINQALSTCNRHEWRRRGWR